MWTIKFKLYRITSFYKKKKKEKLSLTKPQAFDVSWGLRKYTLVTNMVRNCIFYMPQKCQMPLIKLSLLLSFVWLVLASKGSNYSELTVQILCIGTDRSQQTVQTMIRLLLKKQSDQGLRCLPFHQHLLDALMQCYIKLFYF